MNPAGIYDTVTYQGHDKTHLINRFELALELAQWVD
jgi:hypothetical protein